MSSSVPRKKFTVRRVLRAGLPAVIAGVLVGLWTLPRMREDFSRGLSMFAMLLIMWALLDDRGVGRGSWSVRRVFELLLFAAVGALLTMGVHWLLR